MAKLRLLHRLVDGNRSHGLVAVERYLIGDDIKPRLLASSEIEQAGRGLAKKIANGTGENRQEQCSGNRHYPSARAYEPTCARKLRYRYGELRLQSLPRR